jgi:tetratricopeptide (TPR) repeat protein
VPDQKQPRMEARQDAPVPPSLARLAKALARRRVRDGIPLGSATEDLGFALAQLPSAYREIIERCDLEGVPGRGVARALGYSPRQFYRLRRRALATLLCTVEGPAGNDALETLDEASVRLGRVLLADGVDLGGLLDEPRARQAIAALRSRIAPGADVVPLVRHLARLAIDDLPEPLRRVAQGTAEGARVRELSQRLGISLRQLYRLRRESDAAVWQAFCRQVERRASGASSNDVLDAIIDQATALHQACESERARRILRAAFAGVDNSNARRTLLLRLVELECDAGDFAAARSALHAFNRMHGTPPGAQTPERDIAAAQVEFMSGKRVEYGPLAPALRRLERLEQDGNVRAWTHALVMGYEAACESALVTGKFHEASLAADRALELCDRIDGAEPLLQARALHEVGMSAIFRLGHLADGLRSLQQSYECCVRADLRRERATAARGLARAYMLAGDYERARDRWEPVLRAPEFLTPAEQLAACIDYATSLVRSGRPGHARGVLETITDHRSHPLAEAYLALTRAEIDLACNAKAAARRGAAAAARASGSAARVRASARCVEAEALRDLGEPAEATRICFEVLELLYEAAPHPATLARALRLAGRLTGSTEYRRAAEQIGAELAGAVG